MVAIKGEIEIGDHCAPDEGDCAEVVQLLCQNHDPSAVVREEVMNEGQGEADNGPKEERDHCHHIQSQTFRLGKESDEKP